MVVWFNAAQLLAKLFFALGSQAGPGAGQGGFEGAALIGQPEVGPLRFQSRPSARGPPDQRAASASFSPIARGSPAVSWLADPMSRDGAGSGSSNAIAAPERWMPARDVAQVGGPSSPLT